ncbi:MAG: protein kinase domain-containing protein [Kofleriaceae bacterium]
MQRSGITTDAGAPDVAPVVFVPGAMIARRYRLEARLGSGGAGTVWRCTDTKLDAIVALKIVSRDVDLERWRREVAMARRIADRNVCRVHDLGDTEDLRFVTMELVEGVSLRSRIGPNLPASEARSLWRQIVSGVAAIHAAGVVHRDLKPENIVVDNDGRAVIVDFGLAREPRALEVGSAKAGEASGSNQTVTDHGVVIGTPRYMSPEQAMGEVVDVRSDVWSLGLVGHELLTGDLPALDRMVRKIAPLADARWPGMGVVLRRCLATPASDRFADARELLAALAPPKRRWPMRLAIGLAIAGAAGGAIALARSGDHAAPTPPPNATQPAPPPTAQTPSRMQQITTTDAAWPSGSPLSIALSPDAKRFAYSTGDGKVYVRELAGGAVITYPLAKADDGRPLLAATLVAGWYSDGSVAQLGSTSRGEWQLLRVFPDGRQQLVYKHARRFVAAISVDDRAAIAIPDAIFTLAPDAATPTQIATLAGEAITQLAWSPDGMHIATARVGGARPDAVVHVMSATGSEVREVWRGQSENLDMLLAWLDDNRLAHSFQDPRTHDTTLETIEIATRATRTHETFRGTYVGIGSGAHGVVAVLRGTANREVQVGDKSFDKLMPVHDRSLRASSLAGWTSDGHVVFAAGATEDKLQVMHASPGAAPVPWTNTEPGLEIPDTIVGNDVIVHYVRNGELVIDRIDPIGTHTELFALPVSSLARMRCAGDRAPPCVLQEVAGTIVRWSDVDPANGARGRVLLERPIGETRPGAIDGALSADGALLAIVDGTSEVTVLDVATSVVEKPRNVAGSSLQSLGFAPTGELWATSIGYRGRLFGLMSFTRYLDPKPHFGPPRDRGPYRDSMRSYGRPAPSPDGARVAVEVRELRLDVWRIDGM